MPAVEPLGVEVPPDEVDGVPVPVPLAGVAGAVGAAAALGNNVAQFS